MCAGDEDTDKVKLRMVACNDSYAVYPPFAFPCVAYECVGNNTVTFSEQKFELPVLLYADVFLCILIH